jgi:hypothetical protein
MSASTMSSATSTKDTSARTYVSESTPDTADNSLKPWQLFVLIALACATAMTWMARSQGFLAVVLLTILMGGAVLAALATLRTVSPLVSPEDDRTPMVGERTRAALEREKTLTLRAIKDLEFDRAMKKVSDEDFRVMSNRLRARATRLIRQLDAGVDYRSRIEQDLVKRMGEKPVEESAVSHAGRTCASCATANDADARFCKSCGAKL